ncbi:MAG: two-component regulator propeller domain-containing protein, partial [Chitinophagales bacterium]
MNRSFPHIFLLFICAFLNVRESNAQLFPFWQYTTADELASSNVNDILQHGSGYLWFATDRGVSRFDGFKFNSYLYAEGLPYAKINSFAQNSNEKIIASTRFKGVYQYGNNFHSYLPASDLSPNDQSITTENHFYSLKRGDYISVTSKQTRLTVKVKLNALPYAMIPLSGLVAVATDQGLMYVSGEGDVQTDQAITDPIFSIYKRGQTIYA